MTPKEGIESIRQAVADSLALDLEEVEPSSRLVTDLSADSLDFLDLVFALEDRFGVKLRETELNFLTHLDLSSPKTMNGEFLTPEAVEPLLTVLSGLKEEPDLTRIKPSQLYSLITVETLWEMVERQLVS